MDISNPVFIAACVFTREHPQLSKVVQEYIHTRFNMPIMRCCVKNYMVKEFENEMQPKISEQWNNFPIILMLMNQTQLFISAIIVWQYFKNSCQRYRLCRFGSWF